MATKAKSGARKVSRASGRTAASRSSRRAGGPSWKQLELSSPGAPPPGEPQLIVIAKAGIKGPSIALAAAALPVPLGGGSKVARVLENRGATARPLFGVSPERVERHVSRLAPAAARAGGFELPAFYHVRAPRERLHDLARELRATGEVEAAYVKPPAQLAAINAMAPAPAPPPSLTPDFSDRQSYLNAAPVGIDARHAWTFAGGRGAGVRVIDLEWAWRLTHENLQDNLTGVLGGVQLDNLGFRNHGTAVIGVVGADRRGFGATGIASDAQMSLVAFEDVTSRSIRFAADKLRSGDIMLLEIHRPGPRHDFESRPDQAGFIAVEWWPDDFAAIQYAVSRGVIVVEAAGNGAEDLDDVIYDEPDAGFPDDWTNPFNRSNRDSGAILVGAGAPPPGTHGRDLYGPDRSRLDFSNHGASVDAQGWGREVTTTGYGDLQGGGPDFEDVWYTDEFAGTSSASPIIVGTLACVQGILRARGQSPLTPAQARDLLRNTGSPQQDHPDRPATERVGNRPDLRAILERLQISPAAPADNVVETKPPPSSLTIPDLPGGARVTITITVDSAQGSTR
jgi:subtilisin family serine protease